MIEIPMRKKQGVERSTILSINGEKTQGSLNHQTITALNRSDKTAPNHTMASNRSPASAASSSAAAPAAATMPIAPSAMAIPKLQHTVQKGQKIPLQLDGSSPLVKACFGWNAANALCDVDVSAFLLDENGTVLGDDWFVFYGQPQSPDKSVVLKSAEQNDRQQIDITFTQLDCRVQRIVFVLTINEAFDKKLHFGMLRDAYVRILTANHAELVSFQMEEYYDTVISMMIGELYQHKGAWKFYAIGNGMAKDLAGICRFYGVDVSES